MATRVVQMNYGTLAIRSIAMHEVARKSGGSRAAVLSDVATALDAEQQAFLQLQFRKVLAKNARPITEEGGLSKSPDHIRQYLAGAVDLLGASQRLATVLQEIQPAVSPAGIFLAADCVIDGTSALLIAKLEHEHGVRVQATRLSGGETTFTVEFLRDLLLTNGSRIFKAALFPQTAGSSQILGVLVDKQFGGSEVAQYFLTTFLGCRLTERPELLTQRFHVASEGWINTVADVEKKGKYLVALLSELQSNKRTLSVDRFARDHLDTEDRDGYVAAVAGSGVPTRDFERNTSLIHSRIGRLRVDTRSGVMLLAPPETLEDGTVTLSENEDTTTTLVVRDHVDRVTGGRGAPGVTR